MDQTPLLNEKQASLYRALIGSANWVITLGHFDVNYATNSLARFSMAPREGHMDAMKRIFGYLKKYHRGCLLMDPNLMDWSQYPTTEDHTWTEMYPNAHEETPYDMPVPKGKPVQITCFMDTDHAHDKITRRSVTGILMFINNTPVKWVSKRQCTVETSTYGSKMVAGRIACEVVLETRCLRMLGVPIDGPALMLGDNLSVVISTSIPSSSLKKKHQAICYHQIQECIAARVIRFVHLESKRNLSNCLTKPLVSDVFLGHIHPILFQRTHTSATGKVQISKGDIKLDTAPCE